MMMCAECKEWMMIGYIGDKEYFVCPICERREEV